jgi:hypothetical protein
LHDSKFQLDRHLLRADRVDREPAFRVDTLLAEDSADGISISPAGSGNVTAVFDRVDAENNFVANNNKYRIGIPASAADRRKSPY